MRILHVIPAVAQRYGGPSQAVTEMCRALQSHGLEVLIATTDADGPSHLPVELGRPIEHEGVPTIFFSRQCSEAYKYSYPLACWLKTNVSKFDVVHIHAVFSHACLAAARACRERGIPYVVRPLGTLAPWSLRQKRLRKRVLWHLAAGAMLRNAAAVHYTTAEERRSAEHSLGLDHGVVIAHGIETGQLQSRQNAGPFREVHPSLGKDPYVLVLSRLHPKKGLELLIEAFLEVIREPGLKDWRLVIAGDGESGYVSSLRSLSGDSHVLFTGWLEGQEKVAALQDAALLALPSLQENFGICVVEALACGVPVLVSPGVNLAGEIKTAGAGWVASLDRENFLRVLAQALSDAGERQIRGRAGREFVNRRFSWPKVAAELTSCYRSILKTNVASLT